LTLTPIVLGNEFIKMLGNRFRETAFGKNSLKFAKETNLNFLFENAF